MTDYSSLLQAVLDHPKDDAPRLILADYLDEHGESERAEFIRVQVELATLPEPELLTFQPILTNHSDRNGGRCTKCAKLPSKCRYHILEDRESELLNHLGNWRKFAPEFPLIMTRTSITLLNDHAHPTWIRGFIVGIELSSKECLQHLDTILTQHPIEIVRLTTLPDNFVIWNGNRYWSIEQMAVDRWPGIEFELPPAGYTSGDSTFTLPPPLSDAVRTTLQQHQDFQGVTDFRPVQEGLYANSGAFIHSIMEPLRALWMDQTVAVSQPAFRSCRVQMNRFRTEYFEIDIGVCGCGIAWHGAPRYLVHAETPHRPAVYRQ